jgi:elongation factor 1-gamma
LDQWLFWSESELLPTVQAYVLPSLSYAHVENVAIEQAKHELNALLQHFDKFLLTHTFIVGERLTIADVNIALNLLSAFTSVLDSKARNQLINVTRWFTTVVNQKLVKEVVGEAKLAEHVATFNLDTYKKHAESAKKNGELFGSLLKFWTQSR